MKEERRKYYLQTLKAGLLSEKQRTCFEYIVKFGPITSNEIIDKIIKVEGEDDAYNTMSWNKIPSQLEAMNIIKMSSRRSCGSSLTKTAGKVKEWDLTFEEPKRLKKINPQVISLLSQAHQSALLAVEIYNKPLIKFKSEGYITLMMIAWTKLFHAYFKDNLIEFHSKDQNGKYILNEDGEKKTWSLSKCIRVFDGLSEPVRQNLTIHIKLRNRIVHGSVDTVIFDAVFFPECQSLLYNFENFITRYFGNQFALNQSLAYALQFSTLRTDKQSEALNDLTYMNQGKIFEFLNLFRMQLKDEVFHSPEYGVRLMAIPQIQNSGRRGVAVEFVNWENLTDNQKENLVKLNAIIKTKKEIQEVSNVGKVKARDIVEKVKELTKSDFNQHDFKCFCYVYSVRPYNIENKKKKDVVKKLCAYDEVHDDYVYYPAFAEVISSALITKNETIDSLKAQFKTKAKKDIKTLFKELLMKL